MSVLKIRDSASGPWQGISSIQGEPGQKGETGGVNDAVKLALMQIVNHVYYDDERRMEYVQELQDALFPPADILSISAVYTPSGTVYDSAELDDLKADLVVTANKANGTTQTISAASYKLYGEIKAGTCSIEVIYRGFVASFTVTVQRQPSGLVDGTYYHAGGSLGGVTVESNRITYAAGQTTSYRYSIPLLNPIRLKAGDVVEFSPSDPSTQQNTNIGVGFNGGSLGDWQPLLPKDKTITMTSDMTATSFYPGCVGAMSGTSFTVSVKVNGEEVIG